MAHERFFNEDFFPAVSLPEPITAGPEDILILEEEWQQEAQTAADILPSDVRSYLRERGYR